MNKNSLTVILFEHPLNEKMRIWLKLEFLLKNLYHHNPLNKITDALSFFQILSNLLDILNRGDLRILILKELNRQQQRLLQWENLKEVNNERTKLLRMELKQCASKLISIPRLSQLLKDDKLISAIRQKLLVPSNCCNFDLPELHIWLNIAQKKRDLQINYWLQKLNPIYTALEKIMNIVRNSSNFKKQICFNGIFQNNKDNEYNELLRILLPLEFMLYPKIAGYKNHYTVRFLSINYDSNIKVPNNLSFSLSCC